MMGDTQNYIATLEKENEYLKSLLDQAGISYDLSHISAIDDVPFDPAQGARILPHEITELDARRFYSMFWGRTDVHAKRSVKKSTGEAGYYPQCNNFWKSGCPRVNGSKIKCQDCKNKAYTQLRPKQIMGHLKGTAENATDVIGIYPLFPDDTCRFLVFDFDNHGVGAEKNDFANADSAWKEEVDTMRQICKINGIDALVERSRSGRGAHIWIFFQAPVAAALARKFGNALLQKGAESVNLKSFHYYDRMLPMQDHLPANGLGNLIALPLQGQALKAGNSAFIDEHWNAYPDQWGVLLTGANTKKENEALIVEMKQVPPDESLILLATSQLAGEGFDFPRLDTLVMATPIADRSLVEQYAGRLNRDYEGKRDVMIYDYVDIHIPMFEKMYHKRLRAYKKIGYQIYSGSASAKQDANAIYDMDNYAGVYEQDLLDANAEIIISSPGISRGKVDKLLNLLKNKQENGLKIIVITWQADRYSYGNTSIFMELHEYMRQSGIEVNLVDNNCEHYCMIDREVVWYGSMNLLGKEDADDNLMRICSPEIAAELLELTFGNEKVQRFLP